MNYNIAKIALNGYLPPFAFIAIRVVVASLILWLLHLSIIKEKIESKKDFFLLMKCGIFGVALNQLLFFKGLSMTTAINASIIMTSSPVLIMIMAYFILKDKINGVKLIGLIMGLSGALLLVFKKEFDLGNDTLWGDLCIFLNATSYCYYLIIVKPLMVKYHPLTVVKWIFTFGCFIVLPFGLYQFQEVNILAFPPKVWMSIGYVILLATVFVYWLNALTLGHVSPTIVGIYIYLQPFFATLSAVLFFGESLGIKQILAALLIFSGVYLVNRPYKPTPKAAKI